MKRIVLIMMGAAWAATSVPASAVQTVLTFDAATMPGAAPACTGTDGGSTDRTCNHLNFIGVDYGSSGTLGVSYNAGGTSTSLRSYVGYTNATSGGAVNFGVGADNQQFSEIVFSPTAGNLVSFRGLDFFPGSATQVIYTLEVRDASNTLIASASGDSTPGSFNPNTAYFSGPLTFRFSNTSGGLVIDNVTVDVIGAATNGVPEPAAWALMVGGFGIAGAALRRRRPTSVSYA
jgi:hypothetical protein